MAIKQTVSLTTNFNTEAIFENAYINVNNVKIEKAYANAIFYIFKKKNGQLLNQKAYSFDYDLNGENPIKQAYQFLKTLPEFSDAVDC
jgi:hypothetical protein